MSKLKDRLQMVAFFIIVFAVLWAPVGIGVPSAHAGPVEDYLPMAVGNEWTYTVPSNQAGVQSMKVLGKQVINGKEGWLLSITDIDEAGFVVVSRVIWQVSNTDGWVILAHSQGSDTVTDSHAFDPPIQLLPPAPAAGWENDYDTADLRVKATVMEETTVQWASSSVPAVKMQFAKSDEDDGTPEYTETLYLAEGVGMVSSSLVRHLPGDPGFFMGTVNLASVNLVSPGGTTGGNTDDSGSGGGCFLNLVLK